MAYFDFHLHVVFKKFICRFEPTYPSTAPATELRGEIDLKNIFLDFAEENFLHILESQSCVDQLTRGNFSLGVAGIAPIEAVFAEREGLFGKLLNSNVTRPVDQRYFSLIRTRQISYYQLFIRELNLYKALANAGLINILTRQPSAVAPAKIMSVAIGMEGGHSLSRARIRRPGYADTMTTEHHDAISKDFQDHPLLSAADSLRHLQQAMWKEGMDLCYLILTHLSYIPEQSIATHAYGIKMITNSAVLPRGFGISPSGRDVIDAAYTLTVKDSNGKSVPAPVLIDIKHMSLKSRLDFYAHRRKNKYEGFPIIASHMGVTGYSIEEWKSAIESDELIVKNGFPVVSATAERKRAGEWGITNKTFTYNAWSINMMDEDIIEVLNSKGLIGISLDVRILGWQRIIGKGDKAEIFSWDDYKYFFPERAARLARRVEGFDESYLVPTQEERHPLALSFNMLHVVWVGQTYTSTDPWKHLCIGSDFDGLIEPLKNCRNAGKLPELERNLIKWLPVAEQAYCKEQQVKPLLPRGSDGRLDETWFRQIIKDIMHDNGKRFMTDWSSRKFK